MDGSLVLVGPQAAFYSVVLDILVSSVRRATPPDLRVRREMTVTLDRKQRPEPDLVVEVVSPESRTRDHERKPILYARAGIEHFWLRKGRHKAGLVCLSLRPCPIEIDFGEIERM